MKNKSIDNKVKEQIFTSAQEEFFTKGYDGARMQSIADNAGINKAMLHYYFKNKEGLFEEVFMHWFQIYFQPLMGVFSEDISLFDKIRKFCETQISIVSQFPNLPLFINSEMAKGNMPMRKVLENMELQKVLQTLAEHIEEEVQKGNILPISPMQLILNMISMNLFPFVSREFLHLIKGVDPVQFQIMMEKRKKEVPEFIIRSIKINTNE